MPRCSEKLSTLWMNDDARSTQRHARISGLWDYRHAEVHRGVDRHRLDFKIVGETLEQEAPMPFIFISFDTGDDHENILSQQQRFGPSREATSLLQLPPFPDDPTAARGSGLPGRARGPAPQKAARPPTGAAGGWISTAPAASHGGRDSLHLSDLSSTMKLVIEIIPAQRIAHR